MALNSRYLPEIKASPLQHHLGRLYPCKPQSPDGLRRFMAVCSPAFLPDNNTHRNENPTKISEETISSLKQDMGGNTVDDISEGIDAVESAIRDIEATGTAICHRIHTASANGDFDAIVRLGCKMQTVSDEKKKLEEQRQALVDKRAKRLNDLHLLYDYNIVGIDGRSGSNGAQPGPNSHGDQKAVDSEAVSITDIESSDDLLMELDSDDSVNSAMDTAHQHTVKMKHNPQDTQVESKDTLFVKSCGRNRNSNSDSDSSTSKTEISKTRRQKVSKRLTDAEYFKDVLNPREAFRFNEDDLRIPPSYDEGTSLLSNHHRMLVDINDHHDAHNIPCGVSKRRWASDITISNALFEIVGVLNKSPGVSLDVITGMNSRTFNRKQWKDSVSAKIIQPFEKDGTTTIRGYIVSINRNHWIKVSLSRCKNHPNGCASIWDPLSPPSRSEVRTSETGQLAAALRKAGIIVTVVPHRVQYDYYLCGYFCVFLLMKDIARFCVPGADVEHCCMNNTPSVKPLVLNPRNRSIQRANTAHVTRFRELIRRLCIKRIIEKGSLAFNGMDDLDVATCLSLMSDPATISPKTRKLAKKSKAECHRDLQRLKDKIKKMATKNDRVFDGSKTVSYIIDLTSDPNENHEMKISRDSKGNINATNSDVARGLAVVNPNTSEAATQSHAKREDHNKKALHARQHNTTPLFPRTTHAGRSGHEESEPIRQSSSPSRQDPTSRTSSQSVRKFDALCTLIANDMTSESGDEKLMTTRFMENVKALLYYGERVRLKRLVYRVARLVPEGTLKRNDYKVIYQI
eukprot:1348773-Amorphochlora_amoeboformis.AAC.1